MTKGNPGLTKAREAALEIGAGLAVPDFGESRGSRETDFNDLHQVKGLDALKQLLIQIVLVLRIW